MLVVMDKVIRTFERYGRVWRPPQACSATLCGERARWKGIRDGLRECIEFLPLSERGLESRLQEVWIEVARRVEGFEVEGGGEWLIPS